MTPLIAFVVFYFIAIYSITKSYKWQNEYIVVSLIILTYLIGTREEWPDMYAYIRAFRNVPSVISGDYSWSLQPVSYSEKGYYLLAAIIKTFSEEPVFYLTVMGAISMYLLKRVLNIFCLIPLLGLCDYIGRFLLNRDFIQMRSSLAVLLIIFGVKFILEKKAWKYFLIIFIAYQFHHMALIGIPFYFFNMINYKKWHIWTALILAAILSQTAAEFITDTVDAYSKDLEYTGYTQGDYVKQALGLRNPMIYFQTGVLIIFAYTEKWIKGLSKYYYIFRNGYFYSTLILIFFCNYTALSGRTSTMFATFEMFMLPMIGRVIPKRQLQILYYIGVGVVLFYFFFSKYTSARQEYFQQIIGF